jgi:hypothetical protein
MNTAEKTNHLLDQSALAWQKSDVEEVLRLTKEVISLDPNHHAAYSNLGTALWASGKPDEAEINFKKSLSIKPDYMEALLNMGTLCHDRGALDEASEYYDKAHKLRPFNADLNWRKSIIALAKGDYVNGWKLYEEGLGVSTIRGKLLEFKSAPWVGNACNHLLICHEQGFGDTLQFIRYAQLCKTRALKVYVLCPKELHKIISSCPWVDGVMETAHDGDFEEYVYTLSLPHLFKTELSTIPNAIPYFAPSQEAISKWVPRFEGVDKMKVGIVWAGNPRKEQVRFRVIDAKRSMNLEKMSKLFDIPVQFYSLQKGEAEKQAAQFPNIVNFMGEVSDFDDTAAIIANLDLVISVDTSVVHLTGALGKPVWVLSRKDACWRWLENRVDSPWYPTAKIYGQPNVGDWDSVIEAIHTDLGRLA